jgi:hypothetical protein
MPARHTSLQDGLLLEADFERAALVDERGCRRDIRSNGWIVIREVRFLKTGPAEETSFLRSVRILTSAISRGSRVPLKSGPDVFADALVPYRCWSRPACSQIPISKHCSDQPRPSRRGFLCVGAPDRGSPTAGSRGMSSSRSFIDCSRS